MTEITTGNVRPPHPTRGGGFAHVHRLSALQLRRGDYDAPMLRRAALAALVATACAACGDNSSPPDEAPCDSWRQWGNNVAHDGATCVAGQPLAAKTSQVVIDPFAQQERADTYGSLVIHYQTPLLDGTEAYMLQKGGTYTPCDTGSNGPDCGQPDELHRLDSQAWSELAYTIDHTGALIQRWAFASDWKPLPGREPVFQPALTDTTLVVPGASGSLWIVDRATGATKSHVQPFGTNADIYVGSPISLSPTGTAYYSAFEVQTSPTEYAHSWLVAVTADGRAEMRDYRDLVPDAPTSCYRFFDANEYAQPWPPPPNPDGTPVLPHMMECGPQRGGLNAAPAVAADGTVFTVSHAYNTTEYSYVIAVDAALNPRWATSLRDILHDGCGVTQICSQYGTPGLNGDTNLPPAATVDDQSTSSPVALPDGGVLYGSFSYYNGFRGHLMRFDAGGAPAGNYDFGWDVTPAVLGSGSDYKILLKDNHYIDRENTPDPWWFFLTELDSSLHPVWSFASTETQSCVPGPAGPMCVDDHPHGFEWCINAPAVDSDGTMYANSEDGHLYAITSDGDLRDRLFLDSALGAAYTPVALDQDGRVYALNNGYLFSAGRATAAR
jgi:outer membrane protein assembly factor BamB